MKKLGVYLNSEQVGTLEQDDSGILCFAYAKEWLGREDASPLSRMLPLSPIPYTGKRARPFFAGILPEAGPRTRIAQLLGISVENDFGLLERIGGECAGAVRLLPEQQQPNDQEPDVRFLNDDELHTMVNELPHRPFLADDQDLRLSLAGAQDKVPVVIEEGRMGLPLGNTPSTHILKPEPDRFPGLVANEFLCMQLASSVGLSAAEVASRMIGSKPCLLVRRYDRIRNEHGNRWMRTHQEDFCQALGHPPERKYQQEGGPIVRECIALLREWSTTPVLDIPAFVDALIFNMLIGNADAHGKNYSMVYHGGTRRMAPLYDVLSTIAWPELTKRPAMSIGNQNSINDLSPAHFKHMADENRLGWPRVRERLHKLADQTLRASQERAGMACDDDMTRLVCESIAARCRRVLEQKETAP